MNSWSELKYEIRPLAAFSSSESVRPVVALTPYSSKPYSYSHILLAAQPILAVSSRTGRHSIKIHLAAIPMFFNFFIPVRILH